MEYQIYTDASVDIPDEVILENGVRIIPMQYSVDGKEHTMYARLTDEEAKRFYQDMRDGKVTKTSQISPYFYEQAFRREAEEGRNVLYLSLSSGLSSTYSSSISAAQQLAEEFPGFHGEMVDSLNTTGGLGILLMDAIQNKKNWMTLEENAAALRKKAERTALWFMVDDLRYLVRGGRLSAAAGFAGTVLNLKPILKMTREGTLAVVAKTHGSLKAENFLADTFAGASDLSLGSNVIISYADCPERAENIRKRILELKPAAHVFLTTMTPIISAHTGPGMCAVAHFGDKEYL